ncbi:MAG: bifunctional (p)ppGpp synthetase/guanosine-3',5'-bis(diphosphate) 3'-pyrophosphohydrolase [Lachnospiraceae bacterium]|jgi:GTP pyrophosphokinase|nr:bifunctional (p)ppGpp synthetase/guanosine-3',5'-bis(diphosphate) 3'-pyrophosphohydrolase [Lachnospiraceae bacterium]
MAEERTHDILHANTSSDEDDLFDDGKIDALHEFVSPEELFSDLIFRVQKYHPSDDTTMISKAYEIAKAAHATQIRKSGEPYIIHPLNVAAILADLELDKETIIAGLLHDVVEDTYMTEEDLVREFGSDVALLVDGVTKLEKIPLTRLDGTLDKSDEKLEMQAENLRKMFLAMAKDIRVIMIKLADRLHNMRTLKYQKPESQIRIARETLEIYCPLASRLGISKVKVELDDLSLKYLEPLVYEDLVQTISSRRSSREAYIKSIVDEVSEHIKTAGIVAQIDGRVKHFFSIYKKMKNQFKTIDQIYDLFAIRIIVDTVSDCYSALGVIHEMYKPIPGRFKDYIAMPKPNRYQSLHTTLFGSGGQPFEVQIRTYDMHKAAEYGIAAHWKYKESSNGKRLEEHEVEKLVWLRQILEWQQDMSDNKEFLNIIKSDLDLFSDSVYCFTPTGEVKNLPAGSTPIDFAYSIHSAVGNQMVGARVNGKVVNFTYELQNGDQIAIITSANSKGPSRDWLNVVKSAQAKNKINQWFKTEFKEENIVKGKELLINYCKSLSVSISDIKKPEYMEHVIRKYGFHDWDSVLAAVGHGGLKEGQIINKLVELYDQDHSKVLTNEQIMEKISSNYSLVKNDRRRSKGGIVVKGSNDLSVRFSKCCSPVPGDEIVGFVTRGRGLSVHRTDCVNIVNIQEMDRERLQEAEWEAPEVDAEKKYIVEIVIYAANRNGLLADVTRELSERSIDILTVNTRTSKQGIATMQMSFEVTDKDELNKVIDKIRLISGVRNIERG